MAMKTNPKTAGRRKKSSQKSLREMIEKKAYEIYERRGGEPGKELDDWLEAEKIVIRKRRVNK